MSPDSISSRTSKALFWGAAGAIVKIAGQLLVQITLARILEPAVFGQYFALLTVVALGANLADCGFGSALIQKEKLNSADVSLVLGWTLALAAVIALLITLSAPILALQFGDESLVPMFRVSAIFVVLQVMTNLSMNLLHRDLHLKSIQIIDVFAYTVCFGAVSITLAINGWGGWSLVIAYAVQVVFTLIASYSICRHTLRPRLRGDRALIHFGLKALVNNITNWSMENLDRILIGKFWGLYTLGLYSVAFNLSKAPLGVLVYAVQSIAFASAARLQDDLVSVRKGFLVAMSAMALATIPLFALVAFESETVLHIVYGPKWIKAVPYMEALAFSIPLISLGAIISAILRGIGEIGAELRCLVTAGVILFSGLVILNSFSFSVAVWVVPAAYLVRLLLLLAAIHRRLHLRIADVLLLFRGALLLALVGVGVAALVGGNPWATEIYAGVLPLLAAASAIMLLFASRFSWFLGKPLMAVVRTKLTQGRLGSVNFAFEKGKR